MNERRITTDGQGNVIGGGFLGKDGVFKSATGDDIKSCITGQFPLPDFCGSPTFPTVDEIIKGTFPMTSNSLYIAPTPAPLTAQQRVVELKKKITEYKSLLTVISDSTAKNFVLLLLGNIEKELTEIQTELNRVPQQTTQVQPPSTWVGIPPYNPGTLYAYDGGQAISRVAGEPYVACAGDNCVTFADTSFLSQNSDAIIESLTRK
jgi:hypothetical protein